MAERWFCLVRKPGSKHQSLIHELVWTSANLRGLFIYCQKAGISWGADCIIYLISQNLNSYFWFPGFRFALLKICSRLLYFTIPHVSTRVCLCKHPQVTVVCLVNHEKLLGHLDVEWCLRYEIYSFSRPGTPLSVLAYPLAVYFQNLFAKESMATMCEILK